MRRSCFKTNALTRRGFTGFFKALTLSVLCLTAFAASAAYTVDENTKVATVTVPNPANDAQNRAALADLQAALDDEKVMTVVLTHTITLPDGTYLSAGNTSPRKIVQVVAPFLPENGKVTLKTSSTAEDAKLDTIDTPLDGSYSTYNLFDITKGAHVTISNITLMGGFEGSRQVNGDGATTGGIDNRGKLEMYDVDITRTGTALLNQPGATAVLADCNIVRNANWYGGGILNFAQATSSSGGTIYSNGGTLIMDRCSLTENESLGPSHGGGAAENQGYMYLNNCIVANNASTEIGGGINNCKGGQLYVMNSTFTGNITTADEYGVTAGGAIGNAGEAGNVYIVNSVFAHNGYDYGEYVNPSSIGRYNGSTSEHLCHLANTVIDATAGMDRLDATNVTVKYDGLFNGYSESGIVAAGGHNEVNGVKYSSDFTHPLVTAPKDDPYRYAQRMTSVETNHYMFALSVYTYFDYSGILDGTSKMPYMGYNNGEAIVALGKDALLPTENMIVDETFDKEKSRLPYNMMGAGYIEPDLDPEKPDDPNFFEVRLGNFTGGKVSGVTVYGDSYLSNSVVTVHAMADSAYYLNGWIINEKVVEDSAQKYVFSFPVTEDIKIVPIFQPVETKIHRARQRYPWNNLVDIDYSVAETNATRYRLVFLATYEENGVTNTIQLRTFRKNANVEETQRLGDREDLHRSGEHRVTWDSAADGVRLKGKKVFYRALACEGEER